MGQALRIAALAVAMLCVATPAQAAWDAGGGGGGESHSKARSLGTVATPTVTVTGSSVYVSWGAPGGVPPDGYVVRRYDGSDQSQPIGASCSGTVSGTSCIEAAVPPGTWTYRVAATRGSNWRGAESAGAGATVEPPKLTLTPATLTSFPTVLSGGIEGFSAGETVTFRLDDPNAGPVLSGSTTPATIPADGQASASVMIPAGTSNGAHAVYAVGSGGTQANAPITVARPEVSASVIAKSSGGRAGRIRPGGTYRIYARVAGDGDPPAGLAALTADVSGITTGQVNVALSHGSYTAGRQSYNYRSAQLTAGGSLSEGPAPYTVKLTDAGGTVTSSGFSVFVDDTRPTAADVQTTNVAGGTVGRAEPGDTLTLSYSEAVEPLSIVSGWDGSTTDVVVHLRNAGGRDRVEVWDATNSLHLPFGTIRLGDSDYTDATCTFGETGVPSTMTLSGATVTVTLGTASGATTTTASTSGMDWRPSATATDEADNPATTTRVTESGAADKDF